MPAFRLLATFTVGFAVLMLSALYHVTLARAEIEGVRHLEGPALALEVGTEATWELDFAATRVESAWPTFQQQPQLTIRGANGATIEVTAEYVRTVKGEDAERSVPAFVDGTFELPGDADASDARTVVASGKEGALQFGTLWMSWEDPLRLQFKVISAPANAGGSLATPTLYGEVPLDYRTARTVARTQWAVFTAVGVLGVIGLALTLRGVRDRPASRT